jgi:hypothetical protein
MAKSRKSGAGSKSIDSFCEELLRKKPHKDAIAWVKEGKKGDIRTIGEQSAEDSRKIVQLLVRAGAEKIHALDIEVGAGLGETTDTLIVELPEARDARSKLFAFATAVSTAHGLGPVSDDGEKFILLHDFKFFFRLADVAKSRYP